ncbi:hypothetical protein JM946_23760 [Steroidobacter sp. S1-65]|uniref:VCBS repeat-containing protein n=1 Tax=Steroidobacter gossypii TaxID=2805490 RepID=A0ABS1X3H5_9GAMM|nr:hypothetical protein [Steroidobacter gossypii]MBM0107773.1 hypothetical protein [Steroidobacter gossypii]
MKSFVVTIALALLLVAGVAAQAQRQKQAYVEIKSEPQTELCVSARQAVHELRDGTNDGLFAKFRDPRTRSTSDVQVAGLSFPALQAKTFATVDDAATERSREVTFYHLDLDNDGSPEMITVVTGGHGAAGDGDTFSILQHDLLSAPQPVRNDEFIQVALQLGGRTHTFYGKQLQFDPAYYMHPFVFRGKHYLLIEGNRASDRPHLVVELLPGASLETRCYF